MIIAEYTDSKGSDVVIEKDEHGVYHISYDGRITQSGDAELVIRWFSCAMHSASHRLMNLENS